jgi:hypothetical protein
VTKLHYVPGYKKQYGRRDNSKGPDVAEAVKRGLDKAGSNIARAGKNIKSAGGYVMSYSRTAGICGNAHAMFGVGGELSACFMRVGDDYALAFVVEEQVGGEISTGFTAGMVWSNADALSQIRGKSAGIGGSAGPLSLSHRGTFDTRNSRGDIVHSVTTGVGPAAGLGGNVGAGHTGIATVDTVRGEVWNWAKSLVAK